MSNSQQLLAQTLAECQTILAQCRISANQAATAAASIGDEGLAPLESPLFTGNPRAPTPLANDASASIATTNWMAAKFGTPNGLATLDNTGVVPVAQLPFAGLTTDGTWNASTNQPHLASSSGTSGHFFVVTVAGSTSLNGNSSWNVGDWALFSNGVWGRVPFTAPPVSNLPLSSLQGIAGATFVGNTSGGSTSPQAISISAILTFLSVATGDFGLGGSIGLVPAPPVGSGGSGAFLAADMTYKVPPNPDLTTYAKLASPAFTGTATAATQARGNFGSALASTAFVINQLAVTADGTLLLKTNGTVSMGTSTYGARIDHIHGTDFSRASATNPQLSGSAGSYNGTLSLSGNLSLNGTTTLSGNITVNGTFTVTGQSPSTIGLRNRLLNAAMSIDQRFSGAVISAGGGQSYTLDRWWASAAGAVNLQRISTGNAAFANALRVQRPAGNSATTPINIGQTIETINCQDLAGVAITLSFYATAGANFSASGSILKTELVTGNGADQGTTSLNASGWTGQTSLINVNQAITTSRVRYSFTATVGASVKEIAVRLSYTPVGVAGASDFVDITGVQLELGSAASIFEWDNFGAQLSKCQRYFELDATGTKLSGGAFDDATGWFSRIFEVEKRITPTMTAFGGAGSDYILSVNGTNQGAGNAPVVNTGNTKQMTLQVSLFFAGSSGSAMWLLFNTGNAKVWYDAEL